MSKQDELLAKELDQAKNGCHQRQKGEEKRLVQVKQTRIRRAEHLRQLRVDQVEVQFESVRREVRAPRSPRTDPTPPLTITVRARAYARRPRRSSIVRSRRCRTGCTMMWSSVSGGRPRGTT